MSVAHENESCDESGVFAMADGGAKRLAVDGVEAAVMQPPWRGWHLPKGPFPIFIFDRTTGAVIAANDAAVRTYGYTRDEFRSRRVGEILPLQGGSSQMVPKLHSSPAVTTVVAHQRRKDGSLFHAEVTAIDVGDADHAGTMVLVRPAPDVPHVVRKPLHARSHTRTRGAPRLMRGNAKTLGPWSKTPVPVERRTPDETGDDALRQSERWTVRQRERTAALCSLTHELTEFVSADVRELVASARNRLCGHADKKGTDILVYCTCERVWLHPASFSQAIYELLENAVRETRPFHPVVVDVQCTAKADVLLQIQDAGFGMRRHVLRELTRRASTPLHWGPGLGVAFACTVIEKHAGLLRFESAVGVGTTASIWLPGRA